MLFCRFGSSAFLRVSLARKMSCKLIFATGEKYQAIKKLSSGTALRNRGCSWMRWIGVWGMRNGALFNRDCVFSVKTQCWKELLVSMTVSRQRMMHGHVIGDS